MRPSARGAAGGGSASIGTGSALWTCPGLGTRMAPAQLLKAGLQGQRWHFCLAFPPESAQFTSCRRTGRPRMSCGGRNAASPQCIVTRSQTAPLTLGKGMYVSYSGNYTCQEHFLPPGSLTGPGLASASLYLPLFSAWHLEQNTQAVKYPAVRADFPISVMQHFCPYCLGAAARTLILRKSCACL